MDLLKAAEKISENYKSEVEKLLNEIQAATTLSEINKIFVSFYRKYTVIPELWIKWLSLESDQSYPDFDAHNENERKNNIREKAKKHFLHQKFIPVNPLWKGGHFNESMFFQFPIIRDVFRYSKIQPTTTLALENALTYPHNYLEEIKEFCEQYSTRPLRTQILNNFLQSKQIYRKLRDENCKIVKNWKENLVEFTDKNFVIRTLEFYLGFFPDLKGVWNFYLNFLYKEKETILFLNVFSRYCRLFTGDQEMTKEYFEEIEYESDHGRIDEISIWWIDIIEIERNFGDFKVAEKMLQKVKEKFNDETFLKYFDWFKTCSSKEENPFIFELPDINSQIKNAKEIEANQNLFFPSKQPPSNLHFTESNAIQNQEFPLPFNCINYLSKTSNPVIKQKLHKSCKFFFLKSQKSALCHRLGIFQKCISSYFEQSLFLNAETFNFDGLNGITVTNLLQIVLPKNPNATSIILSKISCCKILHLQLKRQNLTKAEFDRFPCERIQTVILEYVSILNAENGILPVENVIDSFPNAKKLKIVTYSQIFSPETAQNLANLQRTQNITHFYLGKVPGNFDISFFVFVKKFVLSNASVCVDFESSISTNLKETFLNAGNEILDGMKFSLKFVNDKFYA